MPPTDDDHTYRLSPSVPGPLVPSLQTGLAARLTLSDLTRTARGVASSTWLLAVLIACTSFPAAVLSPTQGLDESWLAALYMAAHRGMHFGSHLVFTYGPLGFLSNPQLFYRSLTGLAVLYAALIHVALCVSLLYVARRSFTLWFAVPLVFVVVGLQTVMDPGTQALPAIAFIWCSSVLARSFDRKSEPSDFVGPGQGDANVLLALGGVAAAVELLVKVNVGVVLLGLWLLTALFRQHGRLRSTSWVVGAFAASLVVVWLTAGQRLFDLPAYLSRSASIASGYSEAMGISVPGRGRDFPVAAVVAVTFLLICYAASRTWAPRARHGLFLLSSLLLFTSFKEGFVRHDPTHSMAFFGVVATASLAFLVQRESRSLVVLGVTVIVAAAFASAPSYKGLFDIGRSFSHISSDVHAVATHAGDRASEAARLRMQGAYALDPRTLAALSGSSVDIFPSETGIAWAYPQIDWSPLPVFQSYSSYTSRLDDLNASVLRSTSAPQRILRQLGGVIDGRHPSFEAPETTLAMLCHYVELSVAAPYEVLVRVQNRCDNPVHVSSQTARAGTTVRAPSPPQGAVLFVRINGLGVGGAERLRTLLYKAQERHIMLDGQLAYPKYSRLVPGTSGGPLILRVPRIADFTGSFAVSAAARSLRVFDDANPHGKLKFEFYAMQIRPRDSSYRF